MREREMPRMSGVPAAATTQKLRATYLTDGHRRTQPTNRPMKSEKKKCIQVTAKGNNTQKIIISNIKKFE